MFINFSYVFSAKKKKKQPEKRPENKVKFSASFVFSRSHNEHEGHGLQTGCLCVCLCFVSCRYTNMYLSDTVRNMSKVIVVVVAAFLHISTHIYHILCSH